MSLSDALSNPFVQKVTAAIIATGLYLLGHKFPDIATELGLLAGGLGIGTVAYHMTPPPPPAK